ncbi:MAG: cupin domain-containing protein [Burkholderiales bacterium]|nr:cupin domain-containing protein [Burkholderiales bacterium]
MPPGKAAFPYHAHSSMEEMCIVLAGSGTLRQDDVTYAIKEGDVIASGIGKAHQIVNTGVVDLRYLVISNNEKVDVVVYPDSKKTLAVSETLGPVLFHMTKQDLTADYYEGEDE